MIYPDLVLSYGVIRLLKKPDVVQKVYNDGLAEFYDVVEKTDEWDTPIRGEFEKGNIQLESWFRYMGITAQDDHYAKADGKILSSKIAIRGNVKVNTKWLIEIDGVDHQVYRTYYNAPRGESELSLMEVIA